MTCARNPLGIPDDEGPYSAFSAFGSTLASLRELVRNLEIDHSALWSPLRRCELGRCRGTCCHDGVYLDPDEAPVLREFIETNRKELEELGIALPEVPIIESSWRGNPPGPKTATRPEPMAARAESYPSHFPDTACVFLMPDARCALQQWSIDRDLPPWFLKPATCWLHPLSLESPASGRGPALLTLPVPETDPQRFPDYDGFSSRTPCGKRAEDGGLPAWQVLRDELEHLGRIGGRDLLAEIQACGESSPPQSGT